jgi:hypothetical protein
MTSTMLIASTIAVMYNRRGSPGSGATITGGDVRYRLSSWNASSALSVQMKGPDLCKTLKNGRACSASLEINRLNTAKQHVSFYTSLMRAGGRIASIILIFSGFASIPQ